jgi:hypothetical protein
LRSKESLTWDPIYSRKPYAFETQFVNRNAAKAYQEPIHDVVVIVTLSPKKNVVAVKWLWKRVLFPTAHKSNQKTNQIVSAYFTTAPHNSPAGRSLACNGFLFISPYFFPLFVMSISNVFHYEICFTLIWIWIPWWVIRWFPVKVLKKRLYGLVINFEIFIDEFWVVAMGDMVWIWRLLHNWKRVVATMLPPWRLLHNWKRVVLLCSHLGGSFINLKKGDGYYGPTLAAPS